LDRTSSTAERSCPFCDVRAKGNLGSGLSPDKPAKTRLNQAQGGEPPSEELDR
jgi:hypothetical protein